MATIKLCDLGYKDCNSLVIGDDEKDILEKVISYLRKNQPQVIKGITLQEKRELKSRIKTLIS